MIAKYLSSQNKINGGKYNIISILQLLMETETIEEIHRTTTLKRLSLH